MKRIASLRHTAKGGHASSVSNRTMIQAISFGLIKTFRRKKWQRKDQSPGNMVSFSSRSGHTDCEIKLPTVPGPFRIWSSVGEIEAVKALCFNRVDRKSV